ncbi:MAG: GspH/FimT family pseudopilin [Desulfobulbales bacterium]|nr:GspH/FimT family pseudopilin [Desulfobulbales bacterium]
MKINKPTAKAANRGSRGFSLVELMVVVAILGIMSIAAVVSINTAKTKLKTFVFNTKIRFNQARFEAVKRSRDVYLDFDFNDDSVLDDRFTIWVDEDGAKPVIYDAANDEIIGEVVFKSQTSLGQYGPEIFCTGCGITGGPASGPGGKTIDDGVSAGGDRFKFQPNGDIPPGTVYFYSPQDDGGSKKVKSGPWAIIVTAGGRTRIDEWQSAGMGWKVN